MIRIIIMLVTAACIGAVLNGCSYRAWYVGFQEEQKRKCYDNPSSTDIQKCVERANMSYDEYSNYRNDVKQQTK